MKRTETSQLKTVRIKPSRIPDNAILSLWDDGWTPSEIAGNLRLPIKLVKSAILTQVEAM